MQPVAKGRTMSQTRTSKPDPRHRKVRKIRAAIRVGVYENDLKLYVAIDRLIERISCDRGPGA